MYYLILDILSNYFYYFILHELKIFTNKDLAEMLPKDKTLYEVEE